MSGLISTIYTNRTRENLDLLELPLTFGKEGYKDTIDYIDRKAYINCQLEGIAIHTVYSDRLYQWDSIKFDMASRKTWNDVGQIFSKKSQEPDKISQFLSLYFEKDCKILAVVTTENRATGYPVSCFLYSDGAKE